MLNSKLPVKAAVVADDDDDDKSAGNKKANAGVKINWVRWPNMERKLKEVGAAFEYYEHVPLSEVNVKKSRENHARIGARLIEDNIESMVIQARTHKILDLPAMVGWRDKDGRVVYNDGVNRDCAVRRLDVTEAAMYILTDPGPTTIETVTRVANGVVGIGATKEEKIQAAMRYHRDHPGCSCADAAKKNGISSGILMQRLRADGLSRRFASDGDMPIPNAELFNDTTLGHLAKILNDVVLRYAATQLLTVPRFSNSYADALQKVVKEAKPSTEEAQLAAVDAEIARQLAERAAESGPRYGSASKQGLVLRGLRQLQRTYDKFFTDVNPKDVITDVDRRNECRELSKQLRATLLKVERNL